MKIFQIITLIAVSILSTPALAVENKDIAGTWEMEGVVDSMNGALQNTRFQYELNFTQDGKYSFAEAGTVKKQGDYKIVTKDTELGNKPVIVISNENVGPEGADKMASPDQVITGLTKDELTLSNDMKNSDAIRYKRKGSTPAANAKPAEKPAETPAK